MFPKYFQKECEKRKAESADEQFERVDPDATVEGFSTGEEEGILQVYLLKTISGHVVFCPNKWNGISESFGWKYDFGFDSLVCSTFSRLNGNSSIPLEASSDVDGECYCIKFPKFIDTLLLLYVYLKTSWLSAFQPSFINFS